MEENNYTRTNQKLGGISQNQILCFIGIVVVPMALSWLFSLLVNLAEEISLRSFSSLPLILIQSLGMIFYVFVILTASFFFFRKTRLKYLHQLIYIVLNILFFVLLFTGLLVSIGPPPSGITLEIQSLTLAVTASIYLFDIIFGSRFFKKE